MEAGTQDGVTQQSVSHEQAMEARLGEQIASIRAVIEQEQAHAASLADQLARCHDRKKRMERAVTALSGEKAQVKRATTTAHGKKAPRQSTLDRVLAVMSAETGMGANDVRDASGLSLTAVQRSLVVLRERELIRRAGRAPKGNGFVYALMPKGEAVGATES